MHITEFIGIYLVILWDKINQFCGRFRMHAQKCLRWLAWEPQCRADEVKPKNIYLQNNNVVVNIRDKNFAEVQFR